MPRLFSTPRTSSLTSSPSTAASFLPGLSDSLRASHALPHAPLRHASVCSTHYSWAHEDVLELKGPLPSEFTLSADVTVKPEVPHLAPRVASLPPPAPLFGSSDPVPLVPPSPSHLLPPLSFPAHPSPAPTRICSLACMVLCSCARAPARAAASARACARGAHV